MTKYCEKCNKIILNEKNTKYVNLCKMCVRVIYTEQSRLGQARRRKESIDVRKEAKERLYSSFNDTQKILFEIMSSKTQVLEKNKSKREEYKRWLDDNKV